MLYRALPALLLGLSACQLPDRWSLTGGSTIDAGLDSALNGERDFDSQYLELGVSGPLGTRQEKAHDCRTHEPIPAASAPVAQPDAPSEVPWTEILLLLGGAGMWKGGEYGYQKVRDRKAKG